MPARRYIIAFTLLALLLALIIPPPDLPETPYNESDSPFVAVQAASPHLDTAPLQPATVATPFAVLLHDFSADWEYLLNSRPVAVVPLPIMLHVLLC